jgi:hypothetical protein
MRKINPILLILIILSILFTQCKKETKNVIVYGPPVQTITFSDVTDLIIDSTGKTINLKATINSKDGLQKVEVLYQPWNVSTTVSSFSDPSKYDLNVPVLIPVNAELKIHSIVIKATDKKGATNFMEVKIGLQDLNYSKLYMADVADVASLNSDLFGVPIVMDKIGSHTYQLIYYAKTANINVRFIPDKTTFTPVAVGLDPDNTQKLITDGTKSLPLQLGDKGYYKITVNTLLLTYNVETFTPTGTPVNEVAIVGRGFYDYPNMNWQNTLPDIILLDKDPANPYLFAKQVKLGTPPGETYTTTQFILTTNNGWTDFWRFDNGLSPELAVFNGGTNTDIPITTTPVSYLFVFDTFTGRVQAIKQ